MIREIINTRYLHLRSYDYAPIWKIKFYHTCVIIDFWRFQIAFGKLEG